MTHPEHQKNTDQYQAFQQRVLQLLTEVAGTKRTPEQWAALRASAWAGDDLLEAAALTFTEHLVQPDDSDYEVGPNQALKERMSQILRHTEPISLTLTRDHWSRARSRAWLAYDLIEAAALTLAEYLLGRKLKTANTTPETEMAFSAA
jgi:hypothetical protein